MKQRHELLPDGSIVLLERRGSVDHRTTSTVPAERGVLPEFITDEFERVMRAVFGG